MRLHTGGTSPEPLGTASPGEPQPPSETVNRSFHNGHAVEVVTAALPSGGFVLLHIRVLVPDGPDFDRHKWVRVSSGSFWSFDCETAAARHGHALAIATLTTK
jgi:hypothetical protein